MEKVFTISDFYGIFSLDSTQADYTLKLTILVFLIFVHSKLAIIRKNFTPDDGRKVKIYIL